MMKTMGETETGFDKLWETHHSGGITISIVGDKLQGQPGDMKTLMSEPGDMKALMSYICRAGECRVSRHSHSGRRHGMPACLPSFAHSRRGAVKTKCVPGSADRTPGADAVKAKCMPRSTDRTPGAN